MHTSESLSTSKHQYIAAIADHIAWTYRDAAVETWDQAHYVLLSTREAYIAAYLDVMNHGMATDPPYEVHRAVASFGSNNPLLRMDHATAAERSPFLLSRLADTVAYAMAIIAAREANGRMTAYETLAA